MKKRTIKFFATLLIVNNIISAQVEYFVQVNPTTCNYTILDSIPIIKYVSLMTSTFDKINRRFVFHGMDNGSGSYLCSVDATNGNTVSIPSMTGQFACVKFDNSTSILYGIHWTSALSNADFVSINPSTLAYTVIKHINLSGIGNDVTFDDVNHRYIFGADDSLGTHRLFTLDAVTGNIIFMPQLALGSIAGIQFDNSSGNLYGIHVDGFSLIGTFNKINIINGNVTLIDTIQADLTGGGTSMGYYTMDEINNRYTFSGVDVNNIHHLTTLDASNGHIISNPAFPVFAPTYNLIETKYDNTTGNLYALHWGPYGETTGIKNYSQNSDNINIFPNPTNDQFFIETITTDKLTVDLYDVNGRHVFSACISDKENINVTSLDNGAYTLTIKTADRVINKKLAILR